MFSPLVGQTQAVELLTQAVKCHRIAPAYLFVGADGIGKSLAAKCFIELIFSSNIETSQLPTLQKRIQQRNHPALLWVEPTYQYQGQRLTAVEAAEKGVKRKTPPVIRLEQIRGITEFLSRPPLEAPRNIVVLEQAETMAESAANALLKTLEEPGKATLILLAPSPESILTTLVSRCQKIPFYRLDSQGMQQILTNTNHREILAHPEILQIAAGSPGNAIAAFKQLQNISSELLTQLKKLPTNYRQALELGKKIDKELDSESQLWLIDYLQQCYWQEYHQTTIIEQLEKTRKQLLCYAQPRLVWECTFLELSKLQK
ncbi:DNA polymerase III subunit delta' [Anabaena sp. FACHB-1237]|uniref:DNA polymerase III subunit delta' n=1 Tax=Anabaena sp. FACHB-1237 TaxID=2692769 RepID=UPI0016806DC7|nr:DNA polymerase III subunit delta' [Anabaena sp. FACHB-1237]MBD2138203.1 DNA polymerase III subunit delta' [Anabaena sp. FACHB-1237]